MLPHSQAATSRCVSFFWTVTIGYAIAVDLLILRTGEPTLARGLLPSMAPMTIWSAGEEFTSSRELAWVITQAHPS